MGFLSNVFKIGRGTTAGDGTGTPARTAALGINENMDKIDNALESINNSAEQSANKATDLSSPNDTNYPSTKAANDAINAAVEAEAIARDAALGTYQPLSEKGAAGGYAGLDANGKVPIANTYNALEEIVEGTYIDETTFNDSLGNPVTPGAAKIYQDTTTGNPTSGKQYRWGGTVFVNINSGSGTTDSVVEGTTNLYHTAARVRTTLLTGLSTVTSGTITAADTVLSAFGKLQASLTSLTTLVGTKLDKGTYTGTAADLATLANSKETTTGAQAKANAAEEAANAYTDARIATLSPAESLTELLTFTSGWEPGTLNANPSATWKEDGILENFSGARTAVPDPDLPRYGLWYIDKVGDTVEIKHGVPSENPEVPSVDDPVNHIDTGIFFHLAAGATTPTDVSGETIYSEGSVGEWAVSGTGTIVTNDTNPRSGTYNILATLTAGQYIEFTAPEAITEGELSYWLENVVGGAYSLVFLGALSKNGRPGSYVFSSPENYDQSSTDWQSQSVPFPSGLSNVTSFRIVAGGALEIRLDDIRIVSGGGSVVSGVSRGEFEALEERVTTLEEGGTGTGADVRLSNLAADLSTAEKNAIKTKLGVSEGGSTIPSEETGNTIVFTQRANYNYTTPATGNIIIDPTGAVKDTVVAFFFQGDTEPTISGADCIMKSGRFTANKKLIYWFLWFNNGYSLNIQVDNRIPLSAPANFSAESSSESSITLAWDAVTDAESYTLLSSTTNDVSTATVIYTGALLTYEDAGLTEDVPVYYWIKATASGKPDSEYSTATATPTEPTIVPLLHDDFSGTTIDTAKWEQTRSGTDVDLAQDDKLIFTDTVTKTSGLAPEKLQSVSLFDSTGVVLVLRFDMAMPVYNDVNFGVGWESSSVNLVSIRSREGKIWTDVYKAGTPSIPESFTGINRDNSFKIVIENQVASFYYYSNGWQLINTMICNDDASYRVTLFRNIDSVNGTVCEVDNVYVTDQDFPTLNP